MAIPKIRVVPLLAAAALVLAACSSKSDTTSASGGGSLSGTIEISGSSTVLPISWLVAENFQGPTPAWMSTWTVRARATASSCSARARPTSAMPRGRSRTRRPKACKKAGINYVELEIGLDGITVMTNPDNAP